MKIISVAKFSYESSLITMKKKVCLALLQIVNRTVALRMYVTSNTSNFNVFYLFVLKVLYINSFTSYFGTSSNFV